MRYGAEFSPPGEEQVGFAHLPSFSVTLKFSASVLLKFKLRHGVFFLYLFSYVCYSLVLRKAKSHPG